MNRKLTKELRLQIIRDLEKRLIKQSIIARKYDVSAQTVNDIKRIYVPDWKLER